MGELTPAKIRRALREGGRDVTFDQDPGLDPGEVIVLLNSKAGPRKWAVVEWTRQPKPGVWTVRVRRYEVGAARFLRSGPLPYTDADRLREDRVHPPTPDVIEKASAESHYRSSGDPLGAGECVDETWLRRFSAEAAASRAARIRGVIEGEA